MFRGPWNWIHEYPQSLFLPAASVESWLLCLLGGRGGILQPGKARPSRRQIGISVAMFVGNYRMEAFCRTMPIIVVTKQPYEGGIVVAIVRGESKN